MILNSHDSELQNQLWPELQNGEKLLWAGRPRQGLIFRSMDLLFIPFSIMWCGFAIFWEYSVLSNDTPWLFKLWGIPFVAVGLYMTFGRFISEAQKRKRTVYGITNERIILQSGFFKTRTEFHELATLSNLAYEKSSSGFGHITFGQKYNRSRFSLNEGWNQVQTSPGLFDIQDPGDVYKLIVDTRNQKIHN
jgi:hypothetical protein